MTIRWNRDLLNRFLAPEISSFCANEIPELSPAHPEATHWIANHFLNGVFRAPLKNQSRQYVFNLLLRAQAVFAAYHRARELTRDFAGKSMPDNPSTYAYFLAVVQWEACLLNLQMFVDVLRAFTAKSVFNAGDGTPEQRAWGMANVIKHWANEVADNKHHEDHTIPMWLVNGGLRTRMLELTFLELSHLVAEAAAIADQLQNVWAVERND